MCSPSVDHSYNESLKTLVSVQSEISVVDYISYQFQVFFFLINAFMRYMLLYLKEKAAISNVSSTHIPTNTHNTEGLRQRIHQSQSQPVTIARYAVSDNIQSTNNFYLQKKTISVF